MNSTTVCPEPEELRQLLDGSLSGQRRHECTDHVDTCACCQARLEELSTAGAGLPEVSRQVDDQPGSDATAAYWPALNALEAQAPKVSASRSAGRAREQIFDFLAPASDAAYLGRLGQFEVMRVIGRGGMGLLLEAFDSRLQRKVAIKVLDPDLVGDEIARQRFCREARAAASITHENVVAVHQVEKSAEGGLPYMVMQLIEGESLEERLARQSPLALPEIVRIGMQTARGLEAAHDQGLIHRDIKPGNILLEPPRDRAKLTDFGLARIADEVKLTQSGFVSGTPLYMSPEQAMGEEADERSDLFSLGAVLYEMCTGRPPFTGESPVLVLRRVAEEKHRPVRELNPLVPMWLAETVDRLLAKRPADRIQSAAHLAELFVYEWARLKASSEELPRVCEDSAKKRARRTRWIAAGVGAVFLALGLLGGRFLSKNGGLSAVISAAEPANVLSANAGAVWSVALDPTGIAAMAVEDGSVRLWDLQTDGIQATFDAHRGMVWSLRFPRMGDWFVSAGEDGLVKIWEPSSPEALRTFEHSHGVRSLALARDDRTVYAGDRGGRIRVWSLDAVSSEPLREGEQPGAVYAVALSPDDGTLATAGSDKSIRLWNAKTLTQKTRLEGHAGPVNSLSFNENGRRLASAGWDKVIRIWDTASGKLVRSWPGHDGDIWAIVYSPGGSKVATGGLDGEVKVWEAETGELLRSFRGHGLAVHALAFSVDGTLLASGGRDGAVRVWRVD